MGMAESETQSEKQTLALGEAMTFATFNCNGLLTNVVEGKRTVPRIHTMLSFFKATQTPVIAVQEPHLRADKSELEVTTDLQQVKEAAEREGFEFLTQWTNNGLRGGVAIFWKKSWQLVNALSVSPRVMMATLRNDDGQLISVIGAHLHHKPAEREKQYQLLRQIRPKLPLADNVVMLADHNSIVTPRVDSEKLTVHDEMPAAVAAREQELLFLSELGVGDAWETAFAPTGESDPATDPKGWTWGFHKEKPTENKQDELDSQASEEEDEEFFVFRNDRHRRRINRVHLSQHMLPKVTRCYTHFLAHSDHKAVIVQISPPPSTQTQRRLRVPTTFLKDPEVMETLSGRLAELPQHLDAWWDAALTEIRQTTFKYEKKVNPKGITEVEALLHESSLTHTTREAQAYLNNRGLVSSPPPRAYALLMSIAEAEAMDRSGVTLMWKLRKEL